MHVVIILLILFILLYYFAIFPGNVQTKAHESISWNYVRPQRASQ